MTSSRVAEERPGEASDWQFIYQPPHIGVFAAGREMAVETAFGMRQNANNKRLATLEKSLIASSRRDRSCLFRHLSTVGAQILPYESGVAAPRNRVLTRRRLLPDLVEG